MNYKVIHGFLFILLLSLSAYMVHTSVVHDTETCEVCIHVQSNDDWLNEDSLHYLVFDTAQHAQFTAENHLAVHTLQNTADLIRGPPCFT